MILETQIWSLGVLTVPELLISQAFPIDRAGKYVHILKFKSTVFFINFIMFTAKSSFFHARILSSNGHFYSTHLFIPYGTSHFSKMATKMFPVPCVLPESCCFSSGGAIFLPLKLGRPLCPPQRIEQNRHCMTSERQALKGPEGFCSASFQDAHLWNQPPCCKESQVPEGGHL